MSLGMYTIIIMHERCLERVYKRAELRNMHMEIESKWKTKKY